MNQIIQAIFALLPDNMSKKITAKDLRDSFELINNRIDTVTESLVGGFQSYDLKATDVVPVDGWQVGLYLATETSADPGTNYPHAGDLKGISGKLNIFAYDGTEWTAVRVDFPVNTAKIPAWTAQSYTAGSQVIDNGKIYESNAAIVAGDVPGVASVWVEKVGGTNVTNELNPFDTEEAVSGKGVYDFLLQNKKYEFVHKELNPVDFSVNGYLNSSGNVIGNIAWSSTNFIPVTKGQTVAFSLYGSKSAGTAIFAVVFYDENKVKINAHEFPNDVNYNDNLYTGTEIVQNDGFVRLSNRIYNNKTDFSAEINGGEPTTQLFATPEQIGEIPIDEDVKIQTTDLTGSLTFTDGSYMTVNGLATEPTMRYAFFDVKKGDAITYKGSAVQNEYVFYLVTETNIIRFVQSVTENVIPAEFIIPSDGVLYYNNRTANGLPQVLLHHKRITENSVFSLVDYIGDKFMVAKEGTAVNVPILSVYPNYVQLLESQIVGVSAFNNNNSPNSSYSLSTFIPVNKGDVIYYSGVIGGHGVGLYSGENKLIAKLALSPNVLQTVTDMRIEIPETGYLIISSQNSTPSTLKIAPAIYEEIDFANLETGTVNTTTETYIELNKPTSLWTVNLIGVLPNSDAITEQMDVEFSENGKPFLKTKGEFSWQGQSSLLNPKKNYTFDVLNADGDSLKLKIGDMIATDSFHLKGFQKDVSLTRDYLTSRMWYNIRKAGAFPDNRIDNLPLDTSLTATDKSYFQEDAKFYADGFPVEIQYNGAFLGIYVFRLKKSRENYKLDNTKKAHVFLEYDYTIAGGPYVLLKWQTFDPIQYELKSPKITGYVPGATITDTDVMNSINGLWAWTTAVYNNSGYVAHENKVVLSAWIDYLIAVELAAHWDGLNQNILLMTHDGVKWSPYIYDTDHTWGIEITLKRDAKTAFVLDYDARGDGENKTFWINFRTIYLTQIKTRYTELRKAGVISIQNIEKNALEFSRPIGYEHYKKEFAKWGYGLNPASHGKLHLRHILTFANSSINYMDSQWLLP